MQLSYLHGCSKLLHVAVLNTRVWELHLSMLRNTVSTALLNCRSIWSAPGTSTPTYLLLYAFRYLTKPKVFIFICGKTFSTGLSCAANLFEDGASQKSQTVLCNFRSDDYDVTVHFFFHLLQRYDDFFVTIKMMYW